MKCNSKHYSIKLQTVISHSYFTKRIKLFSNYFNKKTNKLTHFIYTLHYEMCKFDAVYGDNIEFNDRQMNSRF